MGQLDASIVSLALPPMKVEFSTTSAGVEWVALSYLLTLVALVAPVGTISDWLGRKSVYVFGFGVFTIASVLCAIAPSLEVLILFRIMQAIGAAMLQANSVALIATSVPRNSLSKAIGIQGAAQAVGLALGPTVGGLLVSLGDWRLIFAVNVPFGIAGIIAGWYLLPTSQSLTKRAPIDFGGLGLFVSTVVLAVLALSFVAYPETSTGWIIACAASSAILAVGFGAKSRSSSSPIINLTLFRSRQFSTGIASGVLSYGLLFGVLFAVPMALARSESAARTGLVLTVLPVTLAIMAPIAGYAGDRWGSRAVTSIGMIIATAALVLMGFANGALTLLLIGLILLGVGSGMFTPANNASIMTAAPRHQAGAASGILNMTRGIGTAVGVAVATIVVGSMNPASDSATDLGRAMFVFAAAALIAAVICALSVPPGSGEHSTETRTVRKA